MGKLWLKVRRDNWVMGLDAIVYHLDSDETPAVHKRLGNVGTISALAAEVLPVVGTDSVLIKRVFYSGSHSGDRVPLEELNRLEAEINVLRKNLPERSVFLERFLNDVSHLINKAREEGMPIEFV
jgi:hypothetical protein